jgi:hypothetical protein
MRFLYRRRDFILGLGILQADTERDFDAVFATLTA